MYTFGVLNSTVYVWICGSLHICILIRIRLHEHTYILDFLHKTYVYDMKSKIKSIFANPLNIHNHKSIGNSNSNSNKYNKNNATSSNGSSNRVAVAILNTGYVPSSHLRNSNSSYDSGWLPWLPPQHKVIVIHYLVTDCAHLPKHSRIHIHARIYPLLDTTLQKIGGRPTDRQTGGSRVGGGFNRY